VSSLKVVDSLLGTIRLRCSVHRGKLQVLDTAHGIGIIPHLGQGRFTADLLASKIWCRTAGGSESILNFAEGVGCAVGGNDRGCLEPCIGRILQTGLVRLSIFNWREVSYHKICFRDGVKKFDDILMLLVVVVALGIKC
jgi:hypothetical protein